MISKKYIITEAGVSVTGLPAGTTVESKTVLNERWWLPYQPLNEGAKMLKKDGWRIVSEKSMNELATIGVEKFGSYNTPPANFREISEKEFAQEPYIHNYGDVANRHVQLQYNGEMLSMTLHLNAFGIGWGFCANREYGKLRFFRFELCQHDWMVVERDNCYRLLKCKKCGMEHAIDSSD